MVLETITAQERFATRSCAFPFSRPPLLRGDLSYGFLNRPTVV